MHRIDVVNTQTIETDLIFRGVFVTVYINGVAWKHITEPFKGPEWPPARAAARRVYVSEALAYFAPSAIHPEGWT